MKSLLFIIALLPLSLAAQDISKYSELFYQQLSASCSADLIWEKTVREMGEEAEYAAETHAYRIDCRYGTVTRTDADADKTPGLSEFDFLFEYDCLNPYISDYFDLKKEGESLAAVLKPGNESETPLQKQTFEVDAAGHLRYAESHIVKDTRLYDMEVHIQVWFDEHGKYERHQTETKTAPVLKAPVHTMINAKLVD